MYATFDQPYTYVSADKKSTLKIYPALLKDIFMVMYLSNVLTIDKNSIPDAKVIQMSYLEYLITEEKKNPDFGYMKMLGWLLTIVLKDENLTLRYGFDDKKKPVIILNNNVFSAKDFEEIRQIICFQNEIEIPDDRVAKEIRDAAKLAAEIRRKNSGMKHAGLEDQIIAVSISTGIPIEDVYNVTIRKFNKMLARIDHKLHYEIYLSASMSGFVKFKDKNAIKHWLADLDADKHDGLIAYEEFENKFGKAMQT